MNLLELILKNYKDFKEILSSPILDTSKNIVGWDCIAYTLDHYPISGGTDTDKSTALRICVAEALERSFFRTITSSKIKESFMIDTYPSTCGFACGFENDKTKSRAICEGLERWAWSKWIDEGFHIEKIQVNKHLNLITEELASRFEHTHYFMKNFNLDTKVYTLGIFLGFKKDGVFAGSRVCLKNDDPWQHAVIEASRNLKNFEYAEKDNKFETTQIVRKRALYFGLHKHEAIQRIESCQNKNWPIPKIMILQQFDTDQTNIYLWRCLMHDWVGWHLGEENRFVY